MYTFGGDDGSEESEQREQEYNDLKKHLLSLEGLCLLILIGIILLLFYK